MSATGSNGGSDDGNGAETPPWERPGLRLIKAAGAHTRKLAKGDTTGRGGKPLSPERRAAVERLLPDLTLSRNEIVRRTGVSAPVVTRIARELGRDFAGRPGNGGTVPPGGDRGPANKLDPVRKATIREKRQELAEKLIDDALEERQLRAKLGMDIRARADLTKSLQGLVKAVADLAAVETAERAAESDARAGSDVDEFLRYMAGEAS